MACIDIAARALGVSSAALLGGTVRDRLEMLWVLATSDTQQDIEEARQKVGERTHRHFLVKIGTGDPMEGVQRATAIRNALPEAATVRVDVNQAWDEPTASSVPLQLPEPPLMVTRCSYPPTPPRPPT